MDESVYLNLAKADIMCSLMNKSINEEEIKYLNRQMVDKYSTHQLIFEIYKNINSTKVYSALSEIESNEFDFISSIIKSISNVCNYDIDLSFHSKLWIYSIFMKYNSNFNIEVKGEYLNDISPSLYADKYFLLEYYNSLMDNIMESVPIDLNRLNEVKNKIRSLID